MRHRQPFRAFAGVAELFSKIYDEHFFLTSLHMGPLQAQAEDGPPDLDHPAFSTKDVHQVASKVLEGLSKARRVCQEDGNLGLPLVPAAGR